ncbi:hypothetical protein K439DRAFT_1610256 [Ramaria rubella]|nr:hypothetical protein K439DRAFT_1610256 [Ramaria rubella]
MSRHRFVKKININDELDDDALSDGGDEDLTPQQQEQLDVAVARVRSILGPEDTSGISHTQIKDAVWEYYFDVEKTVEWLLEEQVKLNMAKERKGEGKLFHSALGRCLCCILSSSFELNPKEGTLFGSRPEVVSADIAVPTSPQPPLSALQRLSLAHRNSNPVSKSSLVALASARVSRHDAVPTLDPPPPPTSHLRDSVTKPTDIERIPSMSMLPNRPNLTVPSKLSLLARSKASQSALPVLSSNSLSHGNQPSISRNASFMPYKGSEPSKLALKIQKAREKTTIPQVSIAPSCERIPLFNPSLSRMQASPSPFALLLLSRPYTSEALGPPTHPENTRSPIFTFDAPSPDDIALNARRVPKERDKTFLLPLSKAKKTQSRSPSAGTSKATSSTSLQRRLDAPKTHILLPLQPSKLGITDQQQFDVASLNLKDEPDELVEEEPPPKTTMARERVLEEARAVLEGGREGKKSVNLVVIGHVDAGKSTLMGRMLYELGRIDEKRRTANERASEKIGKSSFSWAWELDGTIEERQRGVTMDIALQNLSTPRRNITVLDAPGHRDFIPNMISGASQADCALLVVDASPGEFEAGFRRGGQTKEHLILVRSLGVSQLVVAVNKLDQVNWDGSRFEGIVEDLRPFLVQSGFPASKTSFVPISAMAGVNLVNRVEDTIGLNAWYNGPTLVDLLDALDPPVRSLDSPLRIPVSNVFKGQTTLSSGLGVSGRICSGVVQVGERLRVLPGEESTIVRVIEHDEDSVSWAAAGSYVTLYLTAIDPIHLSIGTVLCPPDNLVPLVTKFVAQVIIFDIDLPIIAGASVELFHHSQDVPATLSRLIAVLDRTTSVVLKQNPRLGFMHFICRAIEPTLNRVLTKLASAKIEVTVRSTIMIGSSTQASPIPMESFKTNKEMGRVLLRRSGETIAAGIVVELL